MSDRNEVLDFWLTEVGPDGWYSGEAELDATIRDRFMGVWTAAAEGRLGDWCCDPRGTLAFLIVTDQFPRNMFRGEACAFSTDRKALAAGVPAIHRHWDLAIAEPERQFFYLPLMHSESTTDQDHCVRLMLTRLTKTGADNLRHARAHREVIRKFGRFPSRNVALGRENSAAERTFLAEAGYAKVLNTLEA